MASSAETTRPAERTSALAHWIAQEEAPPQDDDLSDIPEDRLPSGWWLLPALVMALPVWGFLIWMVMRA